MRLNIPYELKAKYDEMYKVGKKHNENKKEYK